MLENGQVVIQGEIVMKAVGWNDRREKRGDKGVEGRLLRIKIKRQQVERLCAHRIWRQHPGSYVACEPNRSFKTQALDLGALLHRGIEKRLEEVSLLREFLLRSDVVLAPYWLRATRHGARDCKVRFTKFGRVVEV